MQHIRIAERPLARSFTFAAGGKKSKRSGVLWKIGSGFAINPAIASQYRDIKLRLEALGKNRSKTTPIVRVEIRRLVARKNGILERIECPCTTIYEVKQFVADQIRLNRFSNMRIRVEALTKEEEAEEAQRLIRVDVYERSPERTARRHRQRLESLRGEEIGSRADAKPFVMSGKDKTSLELLRWLYPDSVAPRAEDGQRWYDEFMATESAFENAVPDPKDGNYYPPPPISEAEAEEIDLRDKLQQRWRSGDDPDAPEPIPTLQEWLRGDYKLQIPVLRDLAWRGLGKRYTKSLPQSCHRLCCGKTCRGGTKSARTFAVIFLLLGGRRRTPHQSDFPEPRPSKEKSAWRRLLV